MDYLITIWLEIHLKLNSNAKIFCKCKNEQDFSAKPNTHVCPVCTWQPGALPLLNQEVVTKAIHFAKALNSKLSKKSSFDRKNYFYPDLPMGFQITQFYHPIITEWKVSFFLNNYENQKTVTIHEAHLECDAAKMIHENWKSLLDFNRAWTPLLEIVTDPDFSSADEAVEFAKEIQRLAKWNNLGDADLEKWQMRVDVNISIRKNESDPLWTRVELKNINTFSAIKRAIEAESQRQWDLISKWESVSQETRRRADDENTSYMMRSKEDAVDYRYFPEPDMPALELSENDLKEFDAVKIDRPYDYITKCKEFWFNKEYINALLLDKSLFDFFFWMVNEWFESKTVAKWMVWPMKRALDFVQWDEITLLKSVSEEAKKLWVDAEKLFEEETAFLKSCWNLEWFLDKFQPLFKEFLQVEKEKKLVDNQLKIVFDIVLQSGKSVNEVIKEKWFDAPAMDNSQLEWIVAEVLAANPAIVEQFKWWKESVIWFFVWQVMKKTQGKANPQAVNAELMKQLKS